MRERGAVTAEVAVVLPLVLVMVLVVVQFGLWHHAAEVAHAVAVEGARAGRVEGADAGTAKIQATAALYTLGPRAVTDVEIWAARDAETVQVEVRGRAPSVLPWLHIPVREVVVSPTERFRAPVSEP